VYKQSPGRNGPAEPAAGGANGRAPAACKLFIYYCPDRWGDEELTKAFSVYGKVESANIMRCPQGVSKGFGFVRFDNHISAQQAIQGLNGLKVEGRRLKVEVKLSKGEERSSATGASGYKDFCSLFESQEAEQRPKKLSPESKDVSQFFSNSSTLCKQEELWLVQLVSILYDYDSACIGQETDVATFINPVHPNFGGVPRPKGVDIKVDVIKFILVHAFISLVGLKTDLS